MNNFRLFRIAILTISALAGPALAQMAPLEGHWVLTIGKKPSCALTAAADGAITADAACDTIARWKATSSGVQLQSASGETIAVLKPKDGGYDGSNVADMRAVTLRR